MNKITQRQPEPPLPNNRENRIARRILSMVHSEFFRGPLPHPDLLLKYEQACPGSADRIIKLTENQSKHRQKMESTVVNSNVQNERKGMHYSFILTGMFMIAGVILLILDKQTAGYFSLFGPSIFHAGNYAYKKYKEETEPKKREEEIKNAKKKTKTPKKTDKIKREDFFGLLKKAVRPKK